MENCCCCCRSPPAQSWGQGGAAEQRELGTDGSWWCWAMSSSSSPPRGHQANPWGLQQMLKSQGGAPGASCPPRLSHPTVMKALQKCHCPLSQPGNVGLSSWEGEGSWRGHWAGKEEGELLQQCSGDSSPKPSWCATSFRAQLPLRMRQVDTEEQFALMPL